MNEQSKNQSLSLILDMINRDPTKLLFETATQEEISKTEKSLGVTLPASFKEFLRFSNGASLDNDSIIIFGTQDKGDLLQAGLVQYRLRMDYLPDNLIPFAHQPGAFFCFDTNSKKGAEYQVVRWDDEEKKITKEMGVFLDWLIFTSQRTRTI